MTNILQHTEFREFPQGYQFRPYLCKEYQRLISIQADAEILLLDARPGIGATSLAAEYFCSLPEVGILVVLNTASRMGYSLPFVLEQVLRQGRSIIGEDGGDCSAGEWHKVLIKIQRKARLKNQKVHIIIDGLYQIPPDDDKYILDIVRDVLALGNGDIRHVLTWGENDSEPTFLNKAKIRRASLPSLTDTEAKSFLSENTVGADQLDDILSATSNIPASLASVVRLAKNGPLDSKQLSLGLTEFYELEWGALISAHKGQQDNIQRFFAFLVFSKKALNFKEIKNLCDIDENVFASILQRNAFIKERADGFLSFLSHTHRDFLKYRLNHLSSDVLNSFVGQLASHSTSSDAVQLLPNYFEELGKHEEIVDILTVDNLTEYLLQTKSLTSLRRRNELGFRAAQNISNPIDAYRFGLQNSVVRALEQCESGEARLAALTALGKFDIALDIAQSAPTKELRLLLLSQYAKILSDGNLKVDSVISDVIQELIEELDLTSSKDGALHIAENLLGPFPELAISIVERASKGAQSYQDVAFTHLILNASSSREEGRLNLSEKYSSRIHDAKLQDFLRAAEALLKNKSAEDIQRSVLNLDGGQRSFFLRQWLKTNSNNPAAIAVADYALDEVVRDPTYLPSAADLKEICAPIAKALDLTAAANLLGRIEAQSAALLHGSGTIDRFRLDIELQLAKCALGKLDVEDALTDLYIKVSDLTDSGLKLECSSWLKASLERFPDLPSTLKAELTDACLKLLHAAIEDCLKTTSEHLDIFRGAISALVESSPQAVLQLVKSINTQSRRDSAYAYFIERLVLRRNEAEIQIKWILIALGEIVNDGKKWQACVNCLRNISKRKPLFDESIEKLIRVTTSISDPVGKAHSLKWAVHVSRSYGLTTDLKQGWEDFKEVLLSIDHCWVVPSLAYWYIEKVAAQSKEDANKFLLDYESNPAFKSLPSPQYADLVSNLARLTVVSFEGVLDSVDDWQADLASALSIIDNVPSLELRMDLLGDLAVRCYSRKKHLAFDKVCDEFIVKLIQGASSSAKYIRDNIVAAAYVPLYLKNSQYADELIQHFPVRRQDECRERVISYYITGVAITEPFGDSGYKGVKLTYPEASRIVSLISEVETDAVLGHLFDIFASAITSKGSASEITIQQRSEFSARLFQKIKSSLPDKLNIQHDGWFLFCNAACLKIASDSAVDKWEGLISATKNLPNISDSTYVMSMIANCLPPKLQSLRGSVLREAEARLPLIPSYIDRVRRKIDLSKQFSSVEGEKLIAQRLLSQAMTESLSIKNMEYAVEVRRQIIDAAYSLDQGFASTLIELIDDDLARSRAKIDAKESFNAQKNKKSISELKYKGEDKGLKDLGKMAWDMLGSLNANKMAPRRPDEMTSLLLPASRENLDDIMGFYWWYLRNVQRKFEHAKSKGRLNLRPLFEVTRLAAMLALKVGSQMLTSAQKKIMATTPAMSGFIATAGLEAEALDFIKSWIGDMAPGAVTICDPYFSFEDIDFIKELCFAHSGFSYVVLSCQKGVGDLDSQYRLAWAKVAHVEPPDFRAIHISLDGSFPDKQPIHDRWIICGDRGLRLGTSINSLGKGKLSEISEMDKNSVSAIYAELNPFVTLSRWVKDKKIVYSIVQW